MSPVSFTDEELVLLNALASALPPLARAKFLRAVATMLAATSPGAAQRVSTLHQLALAAQQDFIESDDEKFSRSQRLARYS